MKDDRKKKPTTLNFTKQSQIFLIHDPFYWFSNHIFFLHYDNITTKDKLGMLGI